MNAPLPDPLALHLLTTLAAPRLRASPPVTPPTPDLLAALADTFGAAPASPPPTDADLARAAIAVAAEDPATRDAIDDLLDHGTPPAMGIVETVAVVTAALAILQTEAALERTPAGKWKLELHKKAASDGLLKALAHAIMRALGAEQPPAAPRLPK